jgi:hypothetical protein
VISDGDIRQQLQDWYQKGTNVHIALFEIIVGAITLTWLAALVWSLYVILTTPRQTWRASGMSQIMWLAVVVLMPLIGTALFVIAGYRRLQREAALSAQATT